MKALRQYAGRTSSALERTFSNAAEHINLVWRRTPPPSRPRAFLYYVLCPAQASLTAGDGARGMPGEQLTPQMPAPLWQIPRRMSGQPISRRRK